MRTSRGAAYTTSGAFGGTQRCVKQCIDECGLMNSGLMSALMIGGLMSVLMISGLKSALIISALKSVLKIALIIMG